MACLSLSHLVCLLSGTVKPDVTITVLDRKLQALELPRTNIADVRLGTRGVHYMPDGDIIVAFLDYRLGIV